MNSSFDQVRTRVKICGITQMQDAAFAVRLGVDALGFIFFEKSPRSIDLDSARDIIATLPPFVDRVGVFVNDSISNIVETASAVSLSCVQLHGRETVVFCEELRRKLPCCRLVKAFRVGEESVAEEFSEYHAVVHGFLLDTYKKGAPGGTGEVFDWEIISRLQLQRPVLLAGGLGPENIRDAVARVRPYGVDVNSGVESAPGKKDHRKLESLMCSLNG